MILILIWSSMQKCDFDLKSVLWSWSWFWFSNHFSLCDLDFDLKSITVWSFPSLEVGSKFPPNQWKILIFQVVTFREHHYLAKYCLKCGGAIGLINEVIYPLPLNNSGWIWDSRRNVGLNPPELLRFSFLNCDLPKHSVGIACNHAEISPSQTGPLRLLPRLASHSCC